MNDIYTVRQCFNKSPIRAIVPGSKSITNRALMLAALSSGECAVKCALLSDDSEAFIDCLQRLGFNCKTDAANKIVTVRGEGGKIPCGQGEINVRSAGTAARFLTVMLSVCGGEYLLDSSEQMKRRPMGELITLLRGQGVDIDCLGEEGKFPFVIKSRGLRGGTVKIDTAASSQFLSALMMSAVASENGIVIEATGNRVRGAYVAITEKVMSDFGIDVGREGNIFSVSHNSAFALDEYNVEPDFSAACYFYALGALLGRKTTVKGLNCRSIQGDKKFLKLLEEMGCSLGEENGETVLTGTGKLRGITADMNDFSDQALTLAALAPFADGATEIRNIGHIRRQECDRINAIAENCRAIGALVEEGEDYVRIIPDKIRPCRIRTFDDHRVAMAFSVAGAKIGGVEIENPECTKKTFPDFFCEFEKIYI